MFGDFMIKNISKWWRFVRFLCDCWTFLFTLCFVRCRLDWRAHFISCVSSHKSIVGIWSYGNLSCRCWTWLSREKKHIRSIVRRAGKRMIIHHIGTAILGSILVPVASIPRAIIGFFNDQWGLYCCAHIHVHHLIFCLLSDINAVVCQL